MIKPNPRWWGPCCWRREHPRCKCQWSRLTECNTPYAPPEIRPEQSPQNDIPSPWQGFLYDSSSAFVLIFNYSKYNLIRQKIQIFLLKSPKNPIRVRYFSTDPHHPPERRRTNRRVIEKQHLLHIWAKTRRRCAIGDCKMNCAPKVGHNIEYYERWQVST